MILVDTSIWVDYFDHGSDALHSQLENSEVLIHPFVIGEFAMGSSRHRARVLSDFADLPQVVIAQHEEVMRFIEVHRLHGTGIGFIDAHLLASAELTPDTLLWTKDTRLLARAEKLGLAYTTNG